MAGQSKTHLGGANVTRSAGGEPGVGVVISSTEGEEGEEVGWGLR